ncbi:translationally-controlled tumor protein homolog isoform X2 [Leucoraja erinacea]|uniref:translationally-controlled tumor protein homolog isoform X2 n=1 Tax=Leucoraja erinaceus TaxID=7782 RepID=UPI002456F505|nr:translationally-controlled tumor protein homolog isoform X2 [Leucoraja erinacea]
MRLYRCIISGDEMFSDIYKIREDPKGMFYEVEGKHVTRTEKGIDDNLIGGNASQEAPTEYAEESTCSGVDIVLNHHLKEVTFNRQTYMTYIKDYMKILKGNVQRDNPEALDEFTVNAKAVVGEILKKINQYKFFTGESMDPDAMVGLLNYRSDDTPYMLFFKKGLNVEKC